MKRLYFDNAATSSPKPPAVLRALTDYFTRLGGSPGRGVYTEAREAGELVFRCRQRLASLIGARDPNHIIFTLNCSDALNLAIKGIVLGRLLKDPCATAHVVTTALDHNSVLRPLNALLDLFPGRLAQTRIAPDPATGLIDAAAVRRAIAARHDTCLVAVNHASNVTGALQDAGAIGRVCRELGVPFLLDAAQSLGHVRVNVEEMSVDLLAFPGHKGLLGPPGTGGLWIRPGLESRLIPLREGGTGSRSDLDTQPTSLPDKYEPGSPNAAGILALSEGVQFLLDFSHAGLRGIDAIAAHEQLLSARFLRGLGYDPSPLGGEDADAKRRQVRGSFSHPLPLGEGRGEGHRLRAPRRAAPSPGAVPGGGGGQGGGQVLASASFVPLAHSSPLIPGLTLHGPTTAARRVGVFSITLDGLDPHELSAILESHYGVLTRAGIHCAPLAHDFLGTSPAHGATGATRFSLGPFLTESDIDVATSALAEIAREVHASAAAGCRGHDASS